MSRRKVQMVMPRGGQAPLYQRIADELRADINAGRLEPGKPMPPLAETAGRYETQPMTAREAYQLLAAEGLIAKGPHTYVVVGPPAPLQLRGNPSGEPGSYSLDSWKDDVLAAGGQPMTRLEVRICNPGDLPARAGALLTPEGEPGRIVLRHTVAYVDDLPSQLIDLFIPMKIAERSMDLVVPDDIADVLAEFAKIGHAVTGIREEVVHRPPSADEARVLDIPREMWIAEIHRTGYASGTPVLVQRIVYAAGKYTRVYEWGDS